MSQLIKQAYWHKQKGVTLVELMIALTLGIVVLGGAIQIFISGQQAYQEAQRFNRLQGDLSLVTDLLASDIRAGTIVNSGANLNLLGPSGATAYRLETGNKLVRQVGAGAAEVLSADVINFSTSCISIGGTDCPTAIGMTVQLTIRATDTNNVAVTFRVGVRNNILAEKFKS